MVWDSAGAFFSMGGYAFYVWGAYLVTALALTCEIWAVLRRWRRAGSQRRAADAR